MNRLFVTFLLAFADLPAQTSPAGDRQQRGSRIVEDAIAALGGEKFMTMRDRVEEGRLYSFYREQLSGLTHARLYTRYNPPGPPGELSVRERQSFGKKKEDYAFLLMETEGLEVNFRGIRPFPAPLFDRYKDSTLRNIFYILRYRLKEKGITIEFKETTVVDNNPVDVVEITDGDNRSVTVHFHRTTKLPLRQTYFRRDPETRRRIEELTIYNKYRRVNGVQWPWSVVRFRDGSKTFEMYAENVSIDGKVADDLYAPPADAKRLKPSI